jgi:hypothetical protein
LINNQIASANIQPSSFRNINSTAVVRRKHEVEDIPSDISADEWGEINRYGEVLDKEIKEKEKNTFKTK